MKKLHIVRIGMIGLLLAGAVALSGCSRYNTAHESQGKGRNSELNSRSLEQAGRGRNNPAQDQASRNNGGYGGRQESRDYGAEQLGRAGSGRGQEGRNRDGGFAPLAAPQLKSAPGGPEQSGKSVVDMGTLGNLSGTLVYDQSEWYLHTQNSEYILHFGNSAFLESTGISLREGASIEVRGFVSGEEIAVVAARLDAKVYTFRNEDGRPMWAGQGRGDNRIVQPNRSGSGSDQLRGQGGRGGRGTVPGTGDGAFELRQPESRGGQPGGGGRGLEESQEYPWWYQAPRES